MNNPESDKKTQPVLTKLPNLNEETDKETYLNKGSENSSGKKADAPKKYLLSSSHDGTIKGKIKSFNKYIDLSFYNNYNI